MRAVARPPRKNTGSDAARRIALGSAAAARPPTLLRRPAVRTTSTKRPAARGHQREQNIVVLALARLVREAIEAEDSDDPEPRGQRRRMADPAREAGITLRLSVASSSAA